MQIVVDNRSVCLCGGHVALGRATLVEAVGETDPETSVQNISREFVVGVRRQTARPRLPTIVCTVPQGQPPGYARSDDTGLARADPASSGTFLARVMLNSRHPRGPAVSPTREIVSVYQTSKLCHIPDPPQV